MSSEDSAANNSSGGRLSSNLKVPPLKIVLSSHQSNTIVSMNLGNNGNQSTSNDKDGEPGEQPSRAQKTLNDTTKETGERPRPERSHSIDLKHNDQEIGQARSSKTATASNFSTSSSLSASERSDSTSPSSESESLASNSTIISTPEQHMVTVKGNKNETILKEDAPSPTSHARISRLSAKASANKRSLDAITEPNESTSNNSKDQGSNSNQRITRSSQRAAQQVKAEQVNNDPTVEESASESNNQDKVPETSRKVKRRKGDPTQEPEPDPNSVAAQPPLLMANICSADYQLPPQNSFELYRDIRKRPHSKMMKLNHIQPKVPHGFKDYLINSGPYLLDGNKLGVGISGSRSDVNSAQNGAAKVSGGGCQAKGDVACTRVPSSTRYRATSSQLSQHQRHSSYCVPKIFEPPKTLPIGSPLHMLFLDQEKYRHKMRMQHLKERERSTLAAEQEILRAYNKFAIADVRQKFHLSACTFFYYQERYHYSDLKPNQSKTGSKPSLPNSQASNSTTTTNDESQTIHRKDLSTQGHNESDGAKLVANDDSRKDINPPPRFDGPSDEKESLSAPSPSNDPGNETKAHRGDNRTDSSLNEQNSADVHDASDKTKSVRTKNDEFNDDGAESGCVKSEENKLVDKVNDVPQATVDMDSDNSIYGSLQDSDEPNHKMSDEDLKSFNKEAFIKQLQELDNKWDSIRADMLIRHKNEADSLYAVQSLEWEWKAKEIGALDVRVSCKIEPEFVPRVEVEDIDY